MQEIKCPPSYVRSIFADDNLDIELLKLKHHAVETHLKATWESEVYALTQKVV